jgi:5'-phosphate synthase pdxT subunit
MAERVGIVAVQGDIEAHAAALLRCGADPVRVLRKEQLDGLRALVLPGGESTTIAKGLERLELVAPLCDFARSGRPVLGTCAGAILLCRTSRNHPVPTLGLLDAVALRNGYGRQIDSFAVACDPGGAFDALRCVFIRAPRLEALGPAVETLVTVDGDPVLVRQGNVLAATFHPELTDDVRVHALLLGG